MRLRKSQERTKGAQERKMCQHSANMTPFGLEFGSSWPPLVRTSSMLMQAKKAVGSNTPGAASSAADLEAQEAPKSRPKPKKSMLKNNTFSALIPCAAHVPPRCKEVTKCQCECQWTQFLPGFSALAPSRTSCKKT